MPDGRRERRGATASGRIRRSRDRAAKVQARLPSVTKAPTQNGTPVVVFPMAVGLRGISAKFHGIRCQIPAAPDALKIE